MMSFLCPWIFAIGFIFTERKREKEFNGCKFGEIYLGLEHYKREKEKSKEREKEKSKERVIPGKYFRL